jgi:hypothetical protein
MAKHFRHKDTKPQRLVLIRQGGLCVFVLDALFPVYPGCN